MDIVGCESSVRYLLFFRVPARLKLAQIGGWPVLLTVGSQDKAERIIAAIWAVLERANIPSPQVRIPRSAPPPVTIELIFEDRVHEDFVSREVQRDVSDLRLHPSNSTARLAPSGLDHNKAVKPDRGKRFRDRAEELRTAAEGYDARFEGLFHPGGRNL